MKGLIYHELMLAKKQIALLLAIFMSLLTIHIMFLLSFQFGNLSHNLTEEQREIKTTFENFYYAEVIVLLLTAIGFVANIFSHAKTGWFCFAYTLPGKIKRSVLTTYSCVIATEIIGFGLGCITTIATSAISGKTPTADSWWLLLMILCIMEMVLAVILPIAYWLQDVNKVTVVVMLPICIGMGMAAAHWVNMENDEELLLELLNLKNKIMDFVAGGVPLMILVAIGCMAVSCVVSIAIMQKREG